MNDTQGGGDEMDLAIELCSRLRAQSAVVPPWVVAGSAEAGNQWSMLSAILISSKGGDFMVSVIV
jgi:hypothetical protein